MPGYARGRRGVVDRVLAPHVYPDTNAHARGEQPAWVYSVRFDVAELFPNDEEGPGAVFLDLFEPYLLDDEP